MIWSGAGKGKQGMGAYKNGAARYDMLSARVTERELRDVLEFASARKIGISTAVRLLVNIGLEFMSGGAGDGSNESMQGMQASGTVLHSGAGESDGDVGVAGR